jgi:hypothetical protein
VPNVGNKDVVKVKSGTHRSSSEMRDTGCPALPTTATHDSRAAVADGIAQEATVTGSSSVRAGSGRRQSTAVMTAPNRIMAPPTPQLT